jgi:hypothetical protein
MIHIFVKKFITFYRKKNKVRTKTIILTTILASIFIIGTITPVLASSQLTVTVDPDSDTAIASMKYQRAIFIDYSDGGQLADDLRGKDVFVSFSADTSNSGVKSLLAGLNSYALSKNSQAQFTDLTIHYTATMTGRENSMSVDYKIELLPVIEKFVIRSYSPGSPAILDVDWRGFGVNGPIKVNTAEYGNLEINMPISFIQKFEPALAAAIASGDAGDLASKRLMNADGIKNQPVGNWHFLFDPTGIQVDASQHGLAEELAGNVLSSYTMGESNFREGRQIEQTFEATFSMDKTYTLKTFESADNANIDIIGFATREISGTSEVFGVSPEPPEGYATTSTGEFPAMILYGMAGMAAIGGAAIMMMSKRKLAKEKGHMEQTGIAPSQLTGVATSASSGGYQTVRGEAQVTGLDDYNQHKNFYEEDKPQVEEKKDSDSSNTKGALPKGWKPEK